MKSGYLKPKNAPPKSYRGQLGRRGEDIAAAFLLGKGFSILARNWRCRQGEIDLIVQRDLEIRFVEVKTRTSKLYGYPESSITPKKLAHLQASMEVWLKTNSPTSKRYQADVLAIFAPLGLIPEIRWIEGV